MKKFSAIFMLAALSAANASADLRPLAGSDWARSNPGLLPYQKCEIQAWHGNNIWSSIGGSLFYGGQNFYDDALLRLRCWSDKLGVEWAIPVEITKYRVAGVTAELSNVLWNRQLTVSGLNGKAVKDTFGRFGGLGMGLGAIVGGNVDLLLNHRRVVIRDANAGLRIGVSLGYYSFRLELRPAVTEVECQDSYLLAPVGGGCAAHRQGNVAYERLMDYRFEKIRKK